jgi:alpha-L-fucosidase
MDAAEKYQPGLYKGAYYSMPEWYNPLYVPYGRDDGALPFWGGPSKNPYNGTVEEYTGHIDVGDYISGLQVPQLEILANDYNVDLIWGDIGMAVIVLYAPLTPERLDPVCHKVVRRRGKGRPPGRHQLNNRLGIAGDYITPEMEQFKTVQRLWEACMSVDPFSFGYNKRRKSTAPRGISSTRWLMLSPRAAISS